MNSTEIRTAFINFFQANGHEATVEKYKKPKKTYSCFIENKQNMIQLKHPNDLDYSNLV